VDNVINFFGESSKNFLDDDNFYKLEPKQPEVAILNQVSLPAQQQPDPFAYAQA